MKRLVTEVKKLTAEELLEEFQRFRDSLSRTLMLCDRVIEVGLAVVAGKPAVPAAVAIAIPTRKSPSEEIDVAKAPECFGTLDMKDRGCTEVCLLMLECKKATEAKAKKVEEPKPPKAPEKENVSPVLSKEILARVAELEKSGMSQVAALKKAQLEAQAKQGTAKK